MKNLYLLLMMCFIYTESIAQIPFYDAKSCMNRKALEISETESNKIISFFREKYQNKNVAYELTSLSDSDICHLFIWTGPHDFTPKDNEQYFNIAYKTNDGKNYTFYFTVDLDVDRTPIKGMDIKTLFDLHILTNYRISESIGGDNYKIDLNGILEEPDVSSSSNQSLKNGQ